MHILTVSVAILPVLTFALPPPVDPPLLLVPVSPGLGDAQIPSLIPICQQPVAPGHENEYFYTTRPLCDVAVDTVCTNLSTIPPETYVREKPLTAQTGYQPTDCLATLFVSNLTVVPTVEECRASFLALEDKCIGPAVQPYPSHLGAINAPGVVDRDEFLDHNFLQDVQRPLYGIMSWGVSQVW